MRARGLKPISRVTIWISLEVAPHAGAWIETVASAQHKAKIAVAPHAGAWIETVTSWLATVWAGVAPHAGAWIETFRRPGWKHPRQCRAPCGRVD